MNNHLYTLTVDIFTTSLSKKSDVGPAHSVSCAPAWGPRIPKRRAEAELGVPELMKRAVVSRLMIIATTLSLVQVPFVGPAYSQSSPQAVAMYNLGLNAYKQGSSEAAIIFFRRAADIDPNLADAQYNLGVLYQTQRRWKEALPRFQEVLRVKPNDPDAHYQMALALMDLSRFSEAKQHLTAVPPNSPHFPDAQKRMGICDGQLTGAAAPTAMGSQDPPPLTNVQTDMAGSRSLGYTSQSGSVPSYSAPQPVTQPQYQPPATTYVPPTQPPPVYQPPVQPSYQAAVPPQIASIQPVEPPAVTAPVPPQQPLSSPGPTPVLPNSQVRIIATGFNAPSGLTFDRLGNLYVANFLSNSVDRIAMDGTKTSFATGINLKGPIGLVCDESGNVYVANYIGGTIAKITPAGVATIIAAGFKKPYYLTLDKDGNLFVTQQEDNSIVRVTLPRSMAQRTPTP